MNVDYRWSYIHRIQQICHPLILPVPNNEKKFSVTNFRTDNDIFKAGDVCFKGQDGPSLKKAFQYSSSIKQNVYTLMMTILKINENFFGQNDFLFSPQSYQCPTYVLHIAEGQHLGNGLAKSGHKEHGKRNMLHSPITYFNEFYFQV